ncbi:hypothetical protein BDZ97DRAFT_1900484 [Flammula alnicola]|nr:hypothetical protein BDZ97DRAFT_1900484 [Flammula alnicola]
MDELLHHCLRELAFDGDLGSDVSRLKDFIVDFYAHANASHAQNPDDAFCAFVWSLVVQQPTVLVGLVEPGITSEVWIAPQVSAKRKAMARGEDHIESLPPKLDPIAEPKTTSLDTLCNAYGNRLRLAVEADAIFAAITGSHIRSSKMSPMVYSALQIITRGRDAGVTVVELGKQSGYDQKTCFYLVRQLTEMELVMKVRRGGVGTHFCIHKYFFERKDADIEDPNSLKFTPIDARHLSSLPLVSARVIRLLKASKNHIHASNNMLITIGFSNPTKTDRRFFQSRIREMIQQRLIEKVIVPSNRKKSPNTSVKCFRLVKQDPSTPADSGVAASDIDDDLDDIALAQNGVKLNTTIHKQIINLLEDSGTSGMTLNELSASLCRFDKRTIELLLARADKSHPPSHLNDLRIASLMETSGRERRHRYFTVASFRKLVALEQLDKVSTGYEDVDLNNVGAFFPIAEDQFYDSEEDLIRYSDAFKDNDTTHLQKRKKRLPKNPILPGGKVKRGRPRKSDRKDDDGRRRRTTYEQIDEPATKRPRLAKESVEEPIAPKRKRGRPRKLNNTLLTVPTESKAISIPRTRGRPRLKDASNQSSQEREETHQSSSIQNTVTTPDLGQEFPRHLREDDPVNMNRNDILDGMTEITEILNITENRIASPIAESISNGTTSRIVSVSSKSFAIRSQGLSLNGDSNIATEDSSMPIPSISPKPSILTPGPGRVNVSHLRRENELLRLVEDAGGILNIQTKEFYEGHIKLLESLAQAGEPTSAPAGTRLDKRTATATFSSLEKKGRIKQLKTLVTTFTGVNRPACIASQPQASHFANFVKIDKKLEYGADPASSCRGVLPLQLLQMEQQPDSNEKERWSKNLSRANQLFTYDDSTIREVFLAERTTMAQLYGFIVGKALRCRQLHLSTIQAFESLNPSSHIVSHEKRVIDLSFFCQDLSLELYCSLISPFSYDEELMGFFGTEEGRRTLVRDLPQTLQSSLHLGKSRARSRFLDMLEILRSLELVTPLQPSMSETPFITCPPNGQHPSAFDLASLEGWTANTPMIAPVYWHIYESAPVRLWVASETQPPFWKTVAVATHTNALAYWDDLRKACNNPETDADVQKSNQIPVLSASVVSWKADYFFTWHQTQYLKQFVDASSTLTPLQISDDQERESQLARLCWVTSAPREAVETHFLSAREKLLKGLEKIKKKAKRSQKRADETKLSLAKKAEEARLQREQEWSSLLLGVHPQVLSGPAAVRVERVRVQFLQSGSIKDVSRWEKEIRAALHEADLASSKGLKISNKRVPSDRQPLIHSTGVSTAPSETSIQALIDLQGPPTQSANVSVKRKRKKDSNVASEEQKKQPRRHRFQWNPDFDELARDASVIIRARCRNLPRLDWAAFEQVFPSVPRNTVRQRLSHIKETPGNEAYLRRLEDTWYDLWLTHKGTPELPDDNDRSTSDFDLIKHIEFLRTHIDKNALRVGLAHTTENATFVLPSNLEYLQEYFDLVQVEKTAPDWDFMWNAVIEEGREKKLKRHVISRCPEQFPLSLPSDPDEIILAEGTLKILNVLRRTKMAMGTPPERYDPEQASSLLKSRGDGAINIATRNLLSRGILSKSQRDPQKQKPGRQLKISEINQNAIGGSITRDTFQDAISLLEEIDVNDNGWHEWPLTATDGDCATLIELVSEDKVDFNIDTSLPQAARPALDWNSKKADDDQIETAIAVRYRLDEEVRDSSLDEPQMTAISEMEESLSVETGHKLNADDNPACCRKTTTRGLVDCVACLNNAWSAFRDGLDLDDRNAAEWVLDAVHQAGEDGVKKSDLLVGPLRLNTRRMLVIFYPIGLD